MKKKIVALFLCLTMALGMLGGSTQPVNAQEFSVVVAGASDMNVVITMNMVLGEYGAAYFEAYRADAYAVSEENGKAFDAWVKEIFGVGCTMEEYMSKLCGVGLTAGNVLNAGDAFGVAGEVPTLLIFFEKSISLPLVPGKFYYEDEEAVPVVAPISEIGPTEGNNSHECSLQYLGDEIQVVTTVPEFAGIKKWRVAYNLLASGVDIVVIVPANDCALVKEGNTTKWLSEDGQVVWTITEEEDVITADLTDWGAVPSETVKNWKASGKAINIHYTYRGHSVAISLPAGEIVDNDVEWYGPEYLATVNQKYVVVKDTAGMVVPNDRLYKK